ncbi:MAG: hypothetical protein ABIQ35_02500 [Verrucomicrobiota bacterium]
MNLDLRLSDETRRSITSEISWLRDSGKTVIIEEPRSKKFVQFGWKTLMVDLPSQTLSGDEMQRAESVMSRFGVPKKTYPIGTPQDTVLQTSFQKHFGDDSETAVRVTEAVFREIYLFPSDVHLKFTRVE